MSTRWLSIWSGGLSNDVNSNDAFLRQTMQDKVCRQCLRAYCPGEVVNVKLTRMRLGMHLATVVECGLISRELLEAIGSELFQEYFALGTVYGSNGTPIHTHLTFNPRNRRRFLRSGPGSYLYSCDECGRVGYFDSETLKRYVAKEEIGDELLIADSLAQLLVRQDVYERINPGDHFKLKRVTYPMPIVREARDGLRQEDLYPNPEIRHRPDGSKVEIVYENWVPVGGTFGGGAPRVPMPAAPVSGIEARKAAFKPQEVWQPFEANMAPVLEFVPTREVGAPDRWKVPCRHELNTGASEVDLKRLEEMLGGKRFPALRALWAIHDGARLFFADEGDGGLELYPVARFERHSAVSTSRKTANAAPYWLVVGEIPASGNLLLAQVGGARQGNAALLDHETALPSPLYDSLGELLGALARQPGTVIREELGNFFRLHREREGRIIEWSPS